MKQFKKIKTRAVFVAGLFVLSLAGGFYSASAEMEDMAGMDMPMKNETDKAGKGQVPITLSPHKQRLIGVKTTEVTMKALHKQIRTIGRVDYNERKLRTITTKIEGWIEELGIDATGMPVKKGEMLFSVYSPKLVQAQDEYLMARRSAQNGGRAMTEASRRRLLLWDVSPAQIRDLEKRGETLRALPMLSPASGVVIEKMALAGMYVNPGMPLYQIADLSTVWVYADIYESDLPLVSAGQAARLSFSALPGVFREATVTRVYPYLNKATRTATVRLELENPDGMLAPGMYADVLFDVPITEALVVPDSAVLDSGLRQMVFVSQAGGRFEPRAVMMGQRVRGEVTILKGLNAGEQVVTQGTFLIDSESKMMASMEGMMGLIGMGDWKMEGSKMGEMDMGDMKMDDMDMDGMDMGVGKMEGMGDMNMSASGSASSPENEVSLEGLKLHFSTEPAMPKKGDTMLRLKVSDQAGKAVSDVTVTFDYTMAMPGMEIETLSAKAEKGGLYTATAFLGMKGVWEVEIRITGPDRAPVKATFNVRVGG